MCKCAASNCQVKCNCVSVTSTSLYCLWKTDRCSLYLQVTNSVWSHMRIYFWTFYKHLDLSPVAPELWFFFCFFFFPPPFVWPYQGSILINKTQLVGKNRGCYSMRFRALILFSFNPGFLRVFCLSVMTYIELTMFPAWVLAVTLTTFIRVCVDFLQQKGKKWALE